MSDFTDKRSKECMENTTNNYSPNNVPIPIFVAPIMTGKKAKLLPYITGSLPPIGPISIICINVVMPANSIDILIKKNRVSTGKSKACSSGNYYLWYYITNKHCLDMLQSKNQTHLYRRNIIRIF